MSSKYFHHVIIITPWKLTWSFNPGSFKPSLVEIIQQVLEDDFQNSVIYFYYVTIISPWADFHS